MHVCSRLGFDGGLNSFMADTFAGKKNKKPSARQKNFVSLEFSSEHI